MNLIKKLLALSLTFAFPCIINATTRNSIDHIKKSTQSKEKKLQHKAKKAMDSAEQKLKNAEGLHNKALSLVNRCKKRINQLTTEMTTTTTLNQMPNLHTKIQRAQNDLQEKKLTFNRAEKNLFIALRELETARINYKPYETIQETPKRDNQEKISITKPDEELDNLKARILFFQNIQKGQSK